MSPGILTQCCLLLPTMKDIKSTMNCALGNKEQREIVSGPYKKITCTDWTTDNYISRSSLFIFKIYYYYSVTVVRLFQSFLSASLYLIEAHEFCYTFYNQLVPQTGPTTEYLCSLCRCQGQVWGASSFVYFFQKKTYIYIPIYLSLYVCNTYIDMQPNSFSVLNSVVPLNSSRALNFNFSWT